MLGDISVEILKPAPMDYFALMKFLEFDGSGRTLPLPLCAYNVHHLSINFTSITKLHAYIKSETNKS